MDRDLVEQAQRGDREAFAILARPDDPQLRTVDGDAVFDSIVATVQLRPENAVGE